MPKLFSSARIIKVLENKGFIYISRRGSHVKMRKLGSPMLTTIVPADRKEIPVGTFHSILRQTNLSEEDFKN